MKFSSVIEAIKQRQLLARVAEKLRKIGIQIEFLYLFRETQLSCPAGHSLESDALQAAWLLPQEIDALAAVYPWSTAKELAQRMETGAKCFVLRSDGYIVSSGWVNLKRCDDPVVCFPLKPNEAYFFDAYTVASHRGKGLAPLMRFACAQSLQPQGINTYYSVVDASNSASLRFKRKLGAARHSLHAHIDLGFGRIQWQGQLRRWLTAAEQGAAAA